MKNLLNSFTTKQVLQIVVFILIATYLSSCNDAAKREAGRAVAVFFLGVLQMINLMLFGVTAIVLCIVSASSPKPAYKAVGGIFLGIFAIFTLLGFTAVNDKNPKHFDIYWIFIIELTMIIISVIFLVKPKKVVAQQSAKDDYLDKIINEDEEII